MRGVWFHVHLGQTEWVPILAENGFTFHHAKTDKVAMVRWLPENEPNMVSMIPALIGKPHYTNSVRE